MKDPKYYHYAALENGDRVPRKIKLKILGRKLSTKDRKRVIKEFKEMDRSDGYVPSFICPQCGAESWYHKSYPVEYPEIYCQWRCLRDHTVVAYQDNSPIIIVLDEE